MTWAQVFATIVGTNVLVILLPLWLLQRKRHAQNLEKFNEIIMEREFNPPHFHAEETGPLMAEGIRYRRRASALARTKF